MSWAPATFCPLGRFLITTGCPIAFGKSDLIFPVPKLLSYLSQAITLRAGDVIITGTPAGIGPMLPGDVVEIEIEIEGIGVLRNPVVAERRG